jgi:hypothetical protein
VKALEIFRRLFFSSVLHHLDSCNRERQTVLVDERAGTLDLGKDLHPFGHADKLTNWLINSVQA